MRLDSFRLRHPIAQTELGVETAPDQKVGLPACWCGYVPAARCVRLALLPRRYIAPIDADPVNEGVVAHGGSVGHDSLGG